MHVFIKMTEMQSLITENNEGDTPLMIAEEKNYDDCIELVSFHWYRVQYSQQLCVACICT